MRQLFIFIMTILIWFLTMPAESQEREPRHHAYVKHFLRIYPHRLEKAMAYMPMIEKHSAIHGFDPLVPTVMISCESAWKSGASGTIGEQGLLQVHGVCAKGHNLKTVDGQIEAGIACMAMARDACDGTLKQTITMYMSGRCEARTQRTKIVVERRVRIIQRIREQ
jgi:hypothetical protein